MRADGASRLFRALRLRAHRCARRHLRARRRGRLPAARRQHVHGGDVGDWRHPQGVLTQCAFLCMYVCGLDLYVCVCLPMLGRLVQRPVPLARCSSGYTCD